MSIALEHIAPNDWSGVQRLVEALGNLVLDTGGRSLGIRAGVVAVTFPGAGSISNLATVTHGLGRTPLAVVVTADGTAQGTVITADVRSIGATTFVVAAEFNNLFVPGGGGLNVYWIAIG